MADPEFRIEATPALRVVTPGAKITYRLVKARPDARDPTTLTCQWFVLNDPNTTTWYRPNHAWGPTQTTWEGAQWQWEGRHHVVCRLAVTNEEFVYEQTVASLQSVIAVGPSIPFQKDDPDVVLDAVSRKLDIIVASGKANPPASQDVADRHNNQVAQLTDYRDRLKACLADSVGWARFHVWAEHLAQTSQRRTPLRAFLYKKPFGDWVLVDWTNPTVERMTGEYTGSSATTGDAVRAAFKAWDDGNQYPDGGIMARVEGLYDSATIQTSFDTNGNSRWDSISHFFGYAGLAMAVVAAVVTAVAPVPGSQIVSALLWGAIFSGTISATINIGQRQRYGGRKDDARRKGFVGGDEGVVDHSGRGRRDLRRAPRRLRALRRGQEEPDARPAGEAHRFRQGSPRKPARFGRSEVGEILRDGHGQVGRVEAAQLAAQELIAWTRSTGIAAASSGWPSAMPWVIPRSSCGAWGRSGSGGVRGASSTSSPTDGMRRVRSPTTRR